MDFRESDIKKSDFKQMDLKVIDFKEKIKMDFKKITVKQVIKQTRTIKAPGVDGIPAVYRHGGIQIAKHLLKLYKVYNSDRF